MSFTLARLLLAPLAILMLASFRMPAAEEASSQMLYDVRGAFVTARADVAHDLVAQTDTLLDASIRSTTRAMMLPRTILTVRIAETKRAPILFGNRYSATVLVKAISVGSGELVAEGSFETSVLTFARREADVSLAERIAGRIASEFRLDAPHRGSAVTALVNGARP
jgi:hypothetical protein